MRNSDEIPMFHVSKATVLYTVCPSSAGGGRGKGHFRCTVCSQLSSIHFGCFFEIFSLIVLPICSPSETNAFAAMN